MGTQVMLDGFVPVHPSISINRQAHHVLVLVYIAQSPSMLAYFVPDYMQEKFVSQVSFIKTQYLDNALGQ